MISENKNTCIWSANQIGIASFLSGPLGGCYLLAKNYKILGKDTHSKRSLIVGIIATLILFFASALIEFPQNFPRSFVPIVYTMIIRECAKKFQGVQIKELLNSGAKRNSHFKLILILISFVFLEFIIGFGLIYILSIFD